jgi:hypothetical protein
MMRLSRKAGPEGAGITPPFSGQQRRNIAISWGHVKGKKGKKEGGRRNKEGGIKYEEKQRIK